MFVQRGRCVMEEEKVACGDRPRRIESLLVRAQEEGQ